MKTFSLNVECTSAHQLVAALRFAAECVEDDLPRFDAMAVDEQDEQLEDVEEFTSVLFRVD